MSLLAPHAAGGMLHTDLDKLVKQIQQGDNLAWPGDPRMWLRIGVMERKNQWGRVVATGRRYEIMRTNEDGSESFIGGWRLEQKDEIIFDLTRMRGDSPGFVPAAQQAQEHNDKIQAEGTQLYTDSMGEAMSHLHSIVDETTNGKSRFRQMPGGKGDLIAGRPADEVD